MTSQVVDIIPEVVNKFAIVELVEKFIRKKDSQWCVVSETGKNLGCSPSKGGAERRLAEVEYFKNKKSFGEDLVVKSLDVGELTVTDDELAKFVAEQNYLNAKSLFAKHLPMKHDQADHAGAKGAAGKVAHTPSQIRDAAARQYAKDEAVSIAEAKKKVTSGAHVPTTRKPEKQSSRWRFKDRVKVSGKTGTVIGGAMVTDKNGFRVSGLKVKFDDDSIGEFTDNELKWAKSLVVKADQTCLKTIWSEAYKYYTGKWIAAAQQFVLNKDWNRAALAMAKARDGYQEEKNPKEWGCLDAWRQAYQDKVEGGK